jgi:RNA polymerase sigma factor (sigma-70 family)
VRYCTFSAGNGHDGEDIAAEVFSRFIAKGDALPEDQAARWLFVVARNLCASHHRHSQRTVRLLGQLTEKTEEAPRAWSDPSVWLYVRSLREHARLVVYLHVVEGRPFAEVASVLGKSTSAVKMTFYRSLDQVRADMERDGQGRSVSLAGGPTDA